jgi:hypothetical protein
MTKVLRRHAKLWHEHQRWKKRSANGLIIFVFPAMIFVRDPVPAHAPSIIEWFLWMKMDSFASFSLRISLDREFYYYNCDVNKSARWNWITHGQDSGSFIRAPQPRVPRAWRILSAVGELCHEEEEWARHNLNSYEAGKRIWKIRADRLRIRGSYWCRYGLANYGRVSDNQIQLSKLVEPCMQTVESNANLVSQFSKVQWNLSFRSILLWAQGL